MATRNVPVGPQTGRPGQPGQELIEIRAKLSELAYAGPHLGATTMVDPAGNASEAVGAAQFHLLKGYNRDFVAEYVAFAADHPGTFSTGDQLRLAVYRALRSELANGVVVLRRAAITPYVDIETDPKDYLARLSQPVTLNTRDLYFIGLSSNPTGTDPLVYGQTTYGPRMPGQFYSSEFELPSLVSTSSVLPGTPDTGPSALTPVEDTYTTPGVARFIPHIQLLSRTAKRLSWSDF